MDTPFIENSSDFDASFDSAHIEKIYFCIKIRALLMSKIRVLYIQIISRFDNFRYLRGRGLTAKISFANINTLVILK